MVAPYKLYDRTPMQEFLDGYASGLSWTACWAPGGPFVCDDRFGGKDPDWTAHCELTKQNNEAFRAGWRRGIIDSGRHPNDARLPRAPYTKDNNLWKGLTAS